MTDKVRPRGRKLKDGAGKSHFPGGILGIPVPDLVPAFTRSSRHLTMSVIPSERSEPRDLQPETAAFLREGNLPWGRRHEGISVLLETTFFFQRAKPIVVSPFENPFPTRGRGPWTPAEGSGQARVLSHAIDRPRRTDRQLLGFGVLLASCHLLRTRQGFVFGDGWDSGLEIPPIAAYGGSVGMTVRVSHRDSGVRAGARSGTGIPRIPPGK